MFVHSGSKLLLNSTCILTHLQVDLLLHLDESSVISKLRYKLIPVEEEVELNKYSHLSFGTKLEVVVKGIWYYLWQHTPDFDPAKIEELANTYTPSLVNDNYNNNNNNNILMLLP